MVVMVGLALIMVLISGTVAVEVVARLPLDDPYHHQDSSSLAPTPRQLLPVDYTDNPGPPPPLHVPSRAAGLPKRGRCKCGKANNPPLIIEGADVHLGHITEGPGVHPARIIGGADVHPAHKYPWLVGIKFHLSHVNTSYVCGGSLINAQYVLTAAHCLHDGNGDQFPLSAFHVGVGDHARRSHDDDIPGVTEDIQIVKIISHENYNPPRYDNDIALLKLIKPLNLTKYTELRPVCLPTNDTQTYVGMFGFAYGWGFTRSGDTDSQPEIPQEVRLRILPQNCKGQRTTPRMLCAGYKYGGRDACVGDSGGPLTVVERGRHVQVGIVSFGKGCGLVDHPGIYTRLTKFLKWIKKNTRDAEAC